MAQDITPLKGGCNKSQFHLVLCNLWYLIHIPPPPALALAPIQFPIPTQSYVNNCCTPFRIIYYNDDLLQYYRGSGMNYLGPLAISLISDIPIGMIRPLENIIQLMVSEFWHVAFTASTLNM